MMFAPFAAMWEKRGMLVQGGFLLLTGPVMAAMISPNLMEQASIWCFFSIAQIVAMLFLIRETLVLNWGRAHHRESLFAKKPQLQAAHERKQQQQQQQQAYPVSSEGGKASGKAA